MPKISAPQGRDPGLMISPELSAACLSDLRKKLKPEEVARFGRLKVPAAARLAAAGKIARAMAVRKAAIKPATMAKLEHAGIVFQNARTTILAALAARKKSNAPAILATWASLSRQSKPAPAASLSRMKDPRTAAAASVSRFIIRTAKPMTLKDMTMLVRKIFDLGARSGLANEGLALDTLYTKFQSDRYYVLTLNAPRVATRAQRFHIAAAVRTLGRFASVQPERLETLTLLQPFTFDPDDMTYPLLAETDWPIKRMHLDQLAQLAPPSGGKHQGEGILIGHPDSGWREHPEYDAAQIEKDLSYNAVYDTVGGEETRHDLPESGTFSGAVDSTRFNLTHGTGTGSLMVSAPAEAGRAKLDPVPAKVQDDVGKQSKTADNPEGRDAQITGVAPKAKVLPIKCIKSVILIGDGPLARAIEYAAGEGTKKLEVPVDVISISLGGSPNAGLERIITKAVREKNIIVVAAAGQLQKLSSAFIWDTVAAPGSYQDVICVTASTKNDHPWSSSFHGPSVDIAAPGVGVYHASFDADGKPVIGTGVGTSFSTAAIAGVAAVWLAFWGKANLLARYPHKPLAFVFRQLLMQTANPASSTEGTKDYIWDTAEFGAGIVDVRKLLGTPLPEEADVTEPPAPMDNLLSMLGGGFQNILDAMAVPEDTKNEIASLIQDSAPAGAGLANVAALNVFKAARQVADELAGQWAVFEAAAAASSGAVQTEARRLAAESAAAWAEGTATIEETGEQIADDAEETAATIVEVVEETVTTVTEAAAPLVNAIADSLPHFP